MTRLPARSIVALALQLLLGLTVCDQAWAQTGQCVGDCDGSGAVTITDLVLTANAALGNAPVASCRAGDADGDGTITIDEIIHAVNVALSGCPTPTPAPSGQFLCSAGPRDGQACSGDGECAPSGVCVIAHGICDGGDSDGFRCGCGGGRCSAACSSAFTGTCEGGVNAGEACYLSDNCAGDSPCMPSQKVCLGGLQKGEACLRDDQCFRSTCGSTGRFCCGGDFAGAACVDDSNCTTGEDGSAGTCNAEGSDCLRTFPTRPPPPSGTPVPSPVPVAFTAHVLARVADDPRSLAVADVNGDGLPDVITANSTAGSVSVLLGQPDHRFAPATGSPFSADGSYPVSIAVADLNGDGYPDLVTANQGSDNVSVLLGQADHSFMPAPGSPFVGAPHPNSVAIADLNGDGLPDLVTANGEYYATASVLLQQADHSFVAASGSPFDVEASCASSVTVADIDGDGLPDLVTANGCERDNSVSVLLQQRDHGFTLAAGAPFSIGFGFGPVSVAVADFNSDGRLDVVTANAGGGHGSCNCVSVLLQQPDHTFVPAPGSPFSVRAFGPAAVAVSDLNGDGRPDIVTANTDSHSVTVLLGQADVSFVAAPGSPYPVGSRPVSVAVADVDGDGFFDLITANAYPDSASVLVGNADHSFALAPGSPFRLGPIRPMSVTLADLNGDALLDLATANAGSGDVTILLAQSDHTLVAAPGSPVDVGARSPVASAIGDFNADGLPDLATANAMSYSGNAVYAGNVSVLLQRGDHSFTPAPDSPFATSSEPVAIAAADLDRDGRADLVTTHSYYGNTANVWLAQPDATFSLASGSPVTLGGSRPAAVALADFDGDGLLDLVTANEGSDNVSLLLAQPDGSFSPAPGSPFALDGSRPTALAVADLNGDGLLDLVTANERSGDVSLLLGRPGQSFVPAPGSPFGIGSDTTSIAVADLNGDHLPDVVTASGDGEVSVVLQQADHTFACTPGAPFTVGSRGYYFSIAVGDLNGDGLPDIATAGANGIVVLFQVAP